MLYNVETGERLDTTPDQWSNLLLSGKYNFAPDETVPFKDESGSIVEIPGAEASNYILNPYTTKLRPVGPQEILEINREATYGTPGQMLLTGAEALTSGATVGLSRAAAKKLIDVGVGEEAGRQYLEATEQRAAENPVPAIAVEVVGLIAPGGAASRIGKLAEKTAIKKVTPAIKSLTENKLAQKAGEKTAKYMAEGGLVDGSYEFSRQTVDDAPYNVEAILDRTSEGALFNTILGGTIEGSIKAISKASKKVGEKTLDYLNKFTEGTDDIPKGEFYEVTGFDLENGNSVNFPQKKAVKVKKTEDGLFYDDAKKRVKVELPEGAGINLAEQTSADALGSEFGVQNFYLKNKNIRSSGEKLDEFIKRSAQVDGMISKIDSEFDDLTPIDQQRFQQSKRFRDDLIAAETEGTMTPKELDEMRELVRDAEDDIRRIYEKTSDPQTSFIDEGGPSRDKIIQGIEQRKSRIAYEQSKKDTYPDWLIDEVTRENIDTLGMQREVTPKMLKEARISKLKNLKNELRKNPDAEEVADKIQDLEKFYAPNNAYITELDKQIKKLERLLTKEETAFMAAREMDDLKKITDRFTAYKYVDDGKNVYIDPDALNRATFMAEPIGSAKEGMKGLTRNLLSQYKPTAKAIRRYSNQDLNELADYLKTKYPNKLENFKDVKTPVEFIKKGIDTDLVNANQLRYDAIIRMNNVLESKGKQLALTNEDIANFIDRNILPQFSEAGVVKGKNTIVPKPGMSDKYNAVKKLSDEYRQSGKRVDRLTGQEIFEPLNVKQAIEKRVDIDAKTDWTTLAEKAVNDANKEIRGFIEDSVARRAQRYAPEDFATYSEAKSTLKKALRANDLISNAYNKALKDSGIKPSIFKMGLFGSAGAYIGGLPGALASSAAIGYIDNITKNYGGNLAAYFSEGIAKEGLKFLNKVDTAATSFIEATPTTRRMVVGISGKEAQDTMENDRKKFEEELANGADFAQKFTEENQDIMEIAPQTSMKILQKAQQAREFLLSKMPVNPYQGIPYREKLWRPSSTDIQRYIRYREAVLKPSAILNQLSDGYITPEAVEVLKTIYPDTLERLKQQVFLNYEKAKLIPVEKRLQLEEIFGVPLETTPESFAIYQSNNDLQTIQSQAKAKPNPGVLTQGQTTQLPLGDTTL